MIAPHLNRKLGFLVRTVFRLIYVSILLASPVFAADRPLAIPLIKLEYPGNPPNIRMLYINILKLGRRDVDKPILFDTGSSGMTIDCKVVLPSEMCSEKGIKIKAPVELDGITVTTEKAVLHYGTYDEYGNIATARVVFGSAGANGGTSEPVSFLIRYKKVRRATGEIVGGPLWPMGIFGASPVGGGGPGRKLKSPLLSVTAGRGLVRGYYLDPISDDWTVCTNERRDCPQVGALKIGIPREVRDQFSMSKWRSANDDFNFPTINACIGWGAEPLCKPTLYDTGNSTIAVAGRASKKIGPSLRPGASVEVTAGEHADWNFETIYEPEVEFVPRLNHHIIGIRFFEENSLLFDFEAAEMGFRIGQ